MIPHNYIDDKEWEQLPTGKAAPKPSQWIPILEELKQGKIMTFPVESPKQLRGYRIGLARTASSQGMKLEFRATENMLAVRKSSEPYEAKPKTTPKPRKTRSKTIAEEEAEG